MVRWYKKLLVLPLLLAILVPLSDAMAQGGADPLSEVPIPGPDNLAAFDDDLSSKIDGAPVGYSEFVLNEDALIDLGKALFWDMQVGSDGIQACASCHFNAGVDSRSINTLNPGPNDGNGSFELGGPNFQLSAGDFPFHQLSDPFDRLSTVVSSVNEVAGSQGVLGSDFVDIIVGDDEEIEASVGRDQPFLDRSTKSNTRRVTGRNTPSAINAVFNLRNFWDGRANNNFNGVNPFGNRDMYAAVVRDEGTGASPVQILMPLSSLASQAVGPVLSDAEMSAAGRTWPKVGKKMLNLAPLAKQLVDPGDSRLGSYSNGAGIPGLNTTYEAMIQAAINPQWWDSDAVITFAPAPNGTPVPTVVGTGTPSGTDEFNLMEANFSMIFGLAVQAYEQELVSDQTPFDRWAEGDETALSEAQERGFDIFRGKGLCDKCHDGAAMSGATIDNLGIGDEPDPAEIDGLEVENIIERMGMAFHEAEASLVMGIGNFPTQAAGVTVVTLPADPRGMTIEIRDDATDELMMTGVMPGVPGVFPPGPICAEVAEVLFLTVVSPSLDPLVAIGEAEFEVDDDNCMALFSVATEGLPVGEYDVLVGPVEDPDPWGKINSILEDLYDGGFYNIGVRPDMEDVGVGGTDPFGNPLSFAEMELLDPGRADIREGIPGGFLGGDAEPNPPIGSLGEDASVRASFKTPILRNLDMTAPYFHNGGTRTIEEVVLFYNRGGDFSDQTIMSLDPEIVPLELTQAEIDDLVLFLETSLTDERVRNREAPFDNPQLFIPEGHSAIDGVTILAELPAVGAGGGAPFGQFLDGSTTVAPPTVAIASSANELSKGSGTESIANDQDATPTEFALDQNYPNPFNPTTTIRFSLAKDIQVQLDIYNILGQKVKSLVNGELNAGWHAVSWDGTNNAGEQMASGVYIYKLNTPNFEHTRKMSLTK